MTAVSNKIPLRSPGQTLTKTNRQNRKPSIRILRRRQVTDQIDQELAGRRLLLGLYAPLPAGFKRRVEDSVERTFLGKSTLKAQGGDTIHRADVDLYNRLSEGPFASALSRLRALKLSGLGQLLLELYPIFLPYQIAGIAAGHFPHHAAYVIDHLCAILCGENAKEQEFRIGLVAALCHDVGLCRNETRKITEQEVKRRFAEAYAREPRQGPSPTEVEALWKDAVSSRIDHARHGVEITQKLLEQYQTRNPGVLKSSEVDQVLDLILHHDDPKIPGLDRLVSESLDQAWLTAHALPAAWFEERYHQGGLPDPKNVLGQWHHEADALWMLTPDGIVADLMRPEFSKRVSFVEMLEHNLKQHQKIPKIYAALLADKPGLFERYAFIAGTHYRSRSAYAIFRHLEEHTRVWALEADSQSEHGI